MVTVGDLIAKKDYDYIEYRAILDYDVDCFVGGAASKNGELISKNGDTYSKNVEVIRYEEWDNPEENIKNGLTVYCARF